MTAKLKKIKPIIPGGFMELLPQEQIVFNEMFDVIKKTYELFGFAPIETPAIEFTKVLLAKNGGETEKQVWGIQKSDGSGDLSLHFDLTIPLARYVAQRQGDLIFPFRRYQMQKVWRGERNQRGRFREFYQCDIDVIGSDSILIDAEIPSVIFEVFKKLGFSNVVININNRKILNGFLDSVGCEKMSKEILQIIDKIEKQGEKRVVEELKSLNIPIDSVQKILEFIKIKGTDEEIIRKLRSLETSIKFNEGIDELEFVVETMGKIFNIPRTNFQINLSIARGLDYYTGTVYETFLKDHPEIGSICSGGRYDNLVEYYTDRKLPGIGISIGLTRLFYKLKEVGLIKFGVSTPVKVLITQMKDKFKDKNFKIAGKLRKNGINTEVYFGSEKMAKQLRYADRNGIPFVVIIGETEIEEDKISLKSLLSGEQKIVSINDAIEIIKSIDEHE